MIFLNSIHDGFMKLREIAKMSVEKPTSFISHSKSPNKVTISSPLKQVPKPTIVSTAVKRILLPSKPQPLPISPLTKNSSNDDNESADQEITKIFVNQSLARDPALNVTVTLNDSSRESSVTPYLDRPNTPYEGRPLTPAMKRVMGESFDAGRR